MSQAASGDSAKQFTLDPVLQTALSNLNVSLEEELARYRRARLESKVNHHFSPQSTPSVSVDNSITELSPQQHAPNQQDEHLEHHGVEKKFTTTSIHQNQPATQLWQPETDHHTESVNQLPKTENLTTSLANQTPPQDYLESSEQLLNSIPPEEQKSKSTSSWFSPLLSPLGAGAILIFLATGGLVLSVLLAPQNSSERLRLAGNQETNPSQSKTQSVEKSPENTAKIPVNSASKSKLAIFPDLSQSESSDLDLNTLPNLDRNSPQSSEPVAPAPAPDTVTDLAPTQSQKNSNPNPAVPPNSNSNLSKVLLPSVAPPQSTQSPTNPTSPNQNLPSQAQPSVPYAATAIPQETVITTESSTIEIAPAPNSSDYFYVLVDYIDSNSLTQAQTAVKDAYVRNFDIGTKIQMGAFNSASDAQKLIERLKQQGIQASIHRP